MFFFLILKKIQLFKEHNVNLIHCFNIISTLICRYDQIETVVINGLNVIDVDIQFNDITFCLTILTSILANPVHTFDSDFWSTFDQLNLFFIYSF